MKILIHDFGGFPFIIQLARELAMRGNEVTCVYANLLKNARTEAKSDIPNLEVIALPIHEGYRKGKSNILKRFYYEFQYGRKAEMVIRNADSDLVISSNTPTHAQYFIQKACKVSDTPFVYWIQDFYSLAVGQFMRKKIPIAGNLIANLYEALERHIFRQSDYLVPIAESFRPKLESWGIEKNAIKVVHNWAPIEQIPVREKSNAWALRHHLEDKFCFLYSGTMGLKHNPVLIYQLAHFFRNEPAVQIVVVAEGPGMEKIRVMANQMPLPNLTLLPLQPEENYPHVLASSDVLMAVLEKDAGSFSVPSKVLSYLCAERPVLLSAPSDNLASKIINENEAGFAVNTDRPEDFFDAAQKLYQATHQQDETFGRNARTYAERNFPIEVVLNNFESIFAEAKQ